MEHLHMNYLRDLIHRLRCGESERCIAQDMHISRPTVQIPPIGQDTWLPDA